LPPSKTSGLGEQEKEIVALRLKGITQREIAAKYKICIKTVRRREQSALRKVAERFNMSFPSAWKRYKMCLDSKKIKLIGQIDPETMEIRLRELKKGEE